MTSLFRQSLILISSLPLLLALMWASQAKATLQLESPEELLIRAAANRQSLQDVLLDLQLNVWEMRDPATFDGYFFLLARLEPLAASMKLDEVYPGAIKATGLRMVAHGVRWLDFSQRELQDTSYYLRYADGDVISRLLAETELLVRSSSTPVFQRERLERIIAHLELTLNLCEKNFPLRRDLQISVRTLISTIAIEFLRRSDPADPEIERWIMNLRLPSAYAEYVQELHERTLRLGNSPDAATEIRRLARGLDLIGRRIESETFPLPSYIPSGWGDAVVELLLRATTAERISELPEFTALIHRLQARQLQGLASLWFSTEVLPDPRDARAVFSLSQILLGRLRSMSLTREADDFQKRVLRMAAPLEAQRIGLEGHYALRSKDGTHYEFTVVFTRDAVLYAALGTTNGAVNIGFFHVIFDYERGVFVASQREPDLDSSKNQSISFSVDARGRITLENHFALAGHAHLSGDRVATFPSRDSAGSLEIAEGTWEGEMVFKSGGVWKTRLIVTNVGGQLVARLSSDKGVQLNLSSTLSSRSSRLRLTTGRLSQSSWVQLRGEIQGDRLHGVLISGSRGMTTNQFTLRRSQ